MKDEDGNISGSGSQRKQSLVSQNSTPIRERKSTRDHEGIKVGTLSTSSTQRQDIPSNAKIVESDSSEYYEEEIII